MAQTSSDDDRVVATQHIHQVRNIGMTGNRVDAVPKHGGEAGLDGSICFPSLLAEPFSLETLNGSDYIRRTW